MNGLDFNGDGTDDDVLPGASVNAFNSGLDKSDLAWLVDLFNPTLAGSKTSRGQSIPMLRLPANYEFGKNIQTQDLRLSRSFVHHERYKVTLRGERPQSVEYRRPWRVQRQCAGHGQFRTAAKPCGSGVRTGGPRSFQLAARISF